MELKMKDIQRGTKIGPPNRFELYLIYEITVLIKGEKPTISPKALNTF